MDSIIYCSNTGFSRRYAVLLSQKVGIPVFDLSDTEKLPVVGSEIVFVGWLLGGCVQGLDKARKLYRVKAVCAVGMSASGVQSVESLQFRNSLQNVPVFYLQGGFFMEKLRGIHKMMLLLLKNTLGRSLKRKKNPTEADKQSVKMFFEGADYFNEENLNEVISFLKN